MDTVQQLTSKREFVPRDSWIEEAKTRCKSHVWGGRREQEWLANIKQDSTRATATAEKGT
jgi:hypothetical protein